MVQFYSTMLGFRLNENVNRVSGRTDLNNREFELHPKIINDVGSSFSQCSLITFQP